MIPFLVAILCLSIFYEIDKDDFADEKIDNSTYFQSDDFLSQYMYILSKQTQNLIYHNAQYTHVQDGEYTIYYTNQLYDNYPYHYEIKDIYFCIMYQKKVFTNVELTTQTDTLEKIKQYIFQKQNDRKYVSFVNGNVASNSEVIATKAIQYFDHFELTYYTNEYVSPNGTEIEVDTNTNIATDMNLEEDSSVEEREMLEETASETNTNKNITYVHTHITDFQIYSSYQEELINYVNNRKMFFEKLFDHLKPYESIITYTIPINATLLTIICIYLIIAIGHTKEKEAIDLNDFDKIPIEIIVIGIFLLIVILLTITKVLIRWNIEYYYFVISCIIAEYLVSYIFMMATIVSVIKRIKAKILFKQSIIGQILYWVIHFMQKIWKKIKNVLYKKVEMFKNLSQSWSIGGKLLVYVSSYIIINLIFLGLLGGVGFCIDVGIAIYIFYQILEKEVYLKTIEKHLKEMYEGKHPSKLVLSDFRPEFKNAIRYINDISNGFDKAIEEGIKSERLKTELITNVSHDIKTPLTSIINYVDLLKKEEIQSEKAKEYIEVLDNKSQRLKKLTEDLIEASKASSGNVKLEMHAIHLKELIQQSTGEFEDKFQQRKLQVITNFPEEDICIQADNRYMYRIIENIFSNIVKYALENSRVYIDMVKRQEKVVMVIKNISQEKLNITADELMQRFVRGDRSRTTEGSGLGLSISKSLTELQKGTFDLQIDGDLFKIVLTFDMISSQS